MTEYERKMQPAENVIAGKLRSQFKELEGSSSQLLREFQRYKLLVARPHISQELISERETLLAQLSAQTTALKADFSKRSLEGTAPTGKNMPKTVGSIVWAQQLLAKAEESLSFAQSLFSDLGGMAAFAQEGEDFIEEVSSFQKSQFDDWSSDVLEALEDGSGDSGLLLETTGRLMDFEHSDGKLRVHYSDRLVTLLREVRQLGAMGFAIPGKIQCAASTAREFYRHGVILKQVAHFYNHIDDQIIDSQYVMLESYARSLESLIRAPATKSVKSKGASSQTVTWDNAVELEQYVSQLQAAAERLTTENRKLRKYHSTFGDEVVQLMGVDLLRQQDKWKAGMLKLRTTCAELRSQGFAVEALKPWQLHWDYQLYKALEHQYQMGLESLNENLPEIKVDLTFRQQKLQLRPPLEEIRAKYYREMKKFIQIPEKFGGLDNPELFKRLIDRNSESFVTVYRKADSLFQRLGRALTHFKDHVVLGSIDVDDLVESTVTDVADWEHNFKAVKAKGRESEKLPSVIRVDCVTVSTTPVKAAIDDQLQRLFEALLSALRKAVQKHVAEIDEFLDRGLEALSARPETVEEIGRTNAAHAEISKEKPTVKPLFQAAETKNRLLRSVAGSSVDLAPVMARWDKFELMLESHALMIKEQVDVMRSNVEGRVTTFQTAMHSFASRWEALRPKDEALGSRDAAVAAIATIKERRIEFDELASTATTIGADCKHFELEAPDFDELEAVRKDLEDTEALWMLFDEFTSALGKMAEEQWIAFRAHLFDFNDFLDGWIGKLKAMPTNVVTVRIRQDIDRFQELSPLLKYLRGDAYSAEHWADLFRLLCMKSVSIEELTFEMFIEKADMAITNAADIKALNARAQGEISIREALSELDMWGASAQYSLSDYLEAKGKTVKLVKDWKDLISKVGDNRSLLQSLKDSPFYGGFIDKASLWESRLSDLDIILGFLQTVQRKWVHLEPIFGRGALPKEQKRFDAINSDFQSIMSDVERDDRVVSIVGRVGIKSKLESLEDQLSRCQKALSEFLEEKRLAFPRFYFIGDDDLLEILGQSTNPTVIQSHLKKLFAGVHRVGFNQTNTEVLEMHSQLGEVVELSTPVHLHDKVEEWLMNLSHEMVATLETLLEKCVAEENGADPSLYPSQVLCIAEQVRFADRCETAIKSNELDMLKAELTAQLQEYTGQDIIPDDEASTVLEAKLKALIMDIIKMIDIVDVLIKASVQDVMDWAWQKQLRYYLVGGKCRIRMSNADFAYTYEYQGNTPKLVYTPLTDKCYLTLTQGMNLGFGGNPYGPAGTGKTESVKALGDAFGRQVLVFNCDEGIDVKSMGRIFIGLVKCGAWGCFDEFNRLEADVLSAVSMQIQSIQHAIREGHPESVVLGRTVNVDPNSGIFITMNPAGKGYGGRQKLPDNLKQLFRPVAMAKADLALIAEVTLFAEGYKEAKLIGGKMVALYTLSSQLLSKQQHYDWKLRALKTIFRSGGQLLSRHKQANGSEVDLATEMRLIVQSARVNTLSKLTFADAVRFDQLCNDLFPNVTHSDIEYPKLLEAIREVYAEMKLVYMERQVKKMLEFYEQLTQRMGVVLVGPSGSGKSTTWKILKAAMCKIQPEIQTYSVNPKAMPREQLLGHIDMDTREWFDGIITNSARQMVKEPLEVESWMICDGDIDPEWIESLNSVLDDNRLLTMPNGERIQFGPNVNFVFETHDLSCASPATISRMGMIFLSEEDMEAKILVQGWIETCPEEHRVQIQDWINDYFYKMLEWVDNNVAAAEIVVKQSKMGLALNALAQLRDVTSKSEFACALIRGLGGPMVLETRTNLAREVFSVTRETCPDPKRVLDCYVDEMGSMAIYTPDMNAEVTLSDMYVEPLVLTRDAQRTMDTLKPLFKNKEPFIIVGPEGCGKYNLLKHAFGSLRSTAVATIHCNAQTAPGDIKDKLQQMCMMLSTNMGRIYKPRDSESLIMYLKDLNLPKMDKWGTSPLVAFLQQAINYNGFYDDSLEWIGLSNVQIISSMNPSTTLGRSELSTRFSSVVRVVYVDHTEREQLQDVYNAYLTPVMQERLPDDPEWSSPKNIMRLAGSMLAVYEQVRDRFSRDDHSHYLFSPRHLTEWALGLLRYDLQADPLLECWAHEARRIFEDRLVGPDAAKFDALLRNVLRSDWNYQEREGEHAKYFVTFNPAATPTEPAVARVQGKQLMATDKSTMLEIIDQARKTYAREVAELDVLMFDEMIERLVGIDRALSKPGGALLLAGRSGTGRRALVSLTAHMLRMETTTLKITRGYSVKSFKIDLKDAMRKSGVEDEPILLVLEDHHFVESSFMEMINSLLSTGDVPGLYAQNELEPLLSPLKDLASEYGWRGTLYSFFTSRVRANLRVVLVMDCAADDFNVICQSNPALYSKCTLVWMAEWAQESMLTVSRMLLGTTVFDFLEDSSETSKNIAYIHSTAVEFGATPLHFTNVCKTYAKLYTSKRSIKEKQQASFKNGLSKLSEAEALVDELKAKAQEQSILCGRKQLEADQALEDITASMETASKQRTIVEDLQQSLGTEEAKLAQRKKAIDIELAEVGPLLEQTKKAVGGIKPASLNEIRALRSPPAAVRDILVGVLTLMGIHDSSWVSMRSFLAKRGIKEEIINFDARKITPEVREQVEAHLAENAKSFDPVAAKRASVACAPLAGWVKANLQYADVLEKIEPMSRESEKLQSSLKESQDKLSELNNELSSLDEKVASLRKSFEQSTAEGAKLKMQLEAAQSTIASAEALLGKLVGEKDRWETQVATLDEEISQFADHALLASAFITYLPKVSEAQRKDTLVKWAQALNVDEKFSVRGFMASESEELEWRSEGLPSDSLSVENAVIIQNTSLAPYLVDPTSTGSTWLKTRLKDQRLDVINQQDSNFNTALELAVRFGKTLLIQEVDTIDPVLYPLLRNELTVQGPRVSVQVGDKMVDYNEDFKLFLSTRSPAPDIAANARAIITEVNFTVTKAGLSGQLLAATIEHEKPELEEQKTALLREEENLKGQLRECEEALLKELNESSGNILENKALLDSLTQTKMKSATIAEKLEESVNLQISLDRDRDAYLPLAQAAAQIFFVISDLVKVNNMYQFSLAAFLQLFQTALKEKNDGHAPDLRIKLLRSSLQTLTYQYVSRSLFKADRLMFAMHITYGMHPDQFEPKEWDVFCGTLVADKGGDAVRRKESVVQIQTSGPSWVPADRAVALDALLSAFAGLPQALQIRDGNVWGDWVRSPRCEQEFPPDIKRKIRPFQQVLLVQAIRPDRLQSAMALFAGSILNLPDIYAADTSLRTIQAEMNCKEPLLIIVSEGVDPSSDLMELAGQTVGSSRFHEVAMGQGQAEIALAKLAECANTGDWLCLKNLHLVTSWLPVLEKSMKALEPHEGFKLWLTAEAHPKFSSMLLQSSLKITYESPPGIKKNLARTYEGWGADFIKSGSSSRAQALFVLAYLHAIVQERRVYVPQGWSKFYEFSNGDLKTASAIVSRVCNEASENGAEIKWNDIWGLLEMAVYGGRIDTSDDARVLVSYLKQYFNPNIIGSSGGTRLGPGVLMPTSTHIEDYTRLINSLPDIDAPSIFGLPTNIGRSLEQINSAAIIDQLKVLMRSSNISAKFDRQLWQRELAPVLTLWKHLNQGRDLIKARATLPASDTGPVVGFVELEQYNAMVLVQSVHKDLEDLTKVIKGAALLTPEILKIALSLLNRDTPQKWTKLWDGPEDPLKWCREAVHKAMALNSWAEKVRSDSLLSSELDLSELFQPSVFLNALRQQTARATSTPMDSLKFVANFGQSSPGMKVSCKITGLRIQGATFDGRLLAETQRDSAAMLSIPACNAGWVPQDTSTQDGIAITLFQTPAREKTVTSMVLKCSRGEESKWIQAGVALFLKEA